MSLILQPVEKQQTTLVAEIDWIFYMSGMSHLSLFTSLSAVIALMSTQREGSDKCHFACIACK